MNATLTGNQTMIGAVTSDAAGSSCSATRRWSQCTATVAILAPRMIITKTARPMTATPGATVEFTITIENNSLYTISQENVRDDLSGVLDDAAYNGDAFADAGSVSYAAPVLHWSGDVALGATITITYSVTVDNPVLGDESMVGVVSAGIWSNCQLNSADPRCAPVVPVVVATVLTFTVGSDVTSATAGSDVNYTISVVNAGATPYLGATVDQPMSDVAVYHNDATATGGTVSYTAPLLSWTGNIPAMGQVVITFSVTVQAEPNADVMVSTLTSDSPQGNCPEPGTDPRCTATVTISALTIVNSADTISTRPGGTLRFSTVISNQGGTTIQDAIVTLSEADLIDDAVPTARSATSGVLEPDAVDPAVLYWIGDVPARSVVTIRRSYQVKNAPNLGDRVMWTVTGSTIPDNNCRPQVNGPPADPRCQISVTVDVPVLTIVTTADRPGVAPGGTVAYTVVISNPSPLPYTGAAVTVTMTGATDDATYNNDGVATAGTLTPALPTLSWTGDVSADGGTVTITYTMTARAPDPGDGVLASRVSSLTEGASCPPGGSDPTCTTRVSVQRPRLTIITTADTATSVPGATVKFTLTIKNAGVNAAPNISVVTSLAEIVDGATYNGDATATTGTVGYAAPNLTWSGSLVSGSTATITYSVLVAIVGDRTLSSVVTSLAPGSSCHPGRLEPGCTSTVPVSELRILNTFDDISPAGGTSLGFTITATNLGATPFTGVDFVADFLSSVDDGSYNGDAQATSGSLRLLPGGYLLRWTGDVPVGATVTVTGSFALRAYSKPGADSFVVSGVISAASANCREGEQAGGCSDTARVQFPGLTITKSADSPSTVPGGLVYYTIMVANSGQSAYTGATLTEVLPGGATYNGDATATAGTASFSTPALTWLGNLAVGARVTITYSVTADNPAPGHVLTTLATSTSPGSNCPPGGYDPACTLTVEVLRPVLTISTQADSDSATAGGTLAFTITATNNGQVPFIGASFTDNLGGVLDDATYNGDATATSGSVSYAAPGLTWTGDLAVGAAAVVTYTVAVNYPATGNRSLADAVTSEVPGANCTVGGTDPACTATVPVVLPQLDITNVADAGTANPGDVVQLSISVENLGPAPSLGVSVTIDITDALDDARPNGDQVASAGVLGVSAQGLTWAGDIPSGGTIIITGTLTVDDPDTGNRLLVTTVTSDAPGGNCPAGGTDPACTSTVTVNTPALSITRSASSATTTPGEVVSYTIMATNTGTSSPAFTIVESLSGLLADATYNGDATATTGALSYGAPDLTWTGVIVIGATVEITYSVTADASQIGGRALANTVTSSAAGNNCPAGGEDPACTTVVPILIPGLTITKTADTPEVIAGSTVTYTVTVLNTGQSPYTGASYTDSLAGVLDDAVYNNDATSTTGSIGYTQPTMSWVGDLAVGAAAVITYTVTVNSPYTGDQALVSSLTSGSAGANCRPGDPCEVPVDVLTPGLTIVSTAGTGEVATGGIVQYSIVITNSGLAPYTGATVTAMLTGVLDDATYGSDATATSGTVSYTAPELTWTGDLPIGATAVVGYSATAHDPITGDGHLVDAVGSAAAGSNCFSGSQDARCGSDVRVVATAIALSSLPGESAVGGGIGATAGEEGLLTMTVTTNSPTGYIVTVQSEVSALTGARPGNTDTIPIENVQVRETGTGGTFQPLSADDEVVVHSQSTPSTAGGDAISTDYQVDIPFVQADTYSATVEYVAIPQ